MAKNPRGERTCVIPVVCGEKRSTGNEARERNRGKGKAIANFDKVPCAGEIGAKLKPACAGKICGKLAGGLKLRAKEA